VGSVILIKQKASTMLQKISQKLHCLKRGSYSPRFQQRSTPLLKGFNVMADRRLGKPLPIYRNMQMYGLMIFDLVRKIKNLPQIELFADNRSIQVMNGANG